MRNIKCKAGDTTEGPGTHSTGCVCVCVCVGTQMLLLLLSRFSRVQLCSPIDGSSSGSAVLGILQARTLEWVVISFSNA